MVQCYVLGCKSNSLTKIPDISFHAFPNEENLRKKWIACTGRRNWEPPKYSRICSKHFNINMIDKKKIRTHLYPNAIPNKIANDIDDNEDDSHKESLNEFLLFNNMSNNESSQSSPQSRASTEDIRNSHSPQLRDLKLSDMCSQPTIKIEKLEFSDEDDIDSHPESVNEIIVHSNTSNKGFSQSTSQEHASASNTWNIQDSSSFMTSQQTFKRKRHEVEFTARGLVPPVFTPMNDDGTINYGSIPVYAKYLANSGIRAVLVGGTTGEHMSLSADDRKKVIEVWVKEGKANGLHIMVQVGGAPLADVVALTKFCATSGVDSLLTLPELYFKPANVAELVSYVENVANAAPNLPVLYYHIPSMSRVEINMPAFVTAATARIPNFKGIKFTSNDLSEGAQVLRALKNDQEMFLGADTLLAPAALLGIKSSIGTTFSLFPRLAQDILAAVENGEVEKSRVLQEKLSLAIEAHTPEGPWVPIMKAGMEIVTGIKVGPPSLPQTPISTEARKRIQEKLENLGLLDTKFFS